MSIVEVLESMSKDIVQNHLITRAGIVIGAGDEIEETKAAAFHDRPKNLLHLKPKIQAASAIAFLLYCIRVAQSSTENKQICKGFCLKTVLLYEICHTLYEL